MDIRTSDSEKWPKVLDFIAQCRASLVNASARDTAIDYERPRTKRQYQRWLTPEEQTRLVSAYGAGQTVYQLAEEFECTRWTASALLKRHNIRLRLRQPEPAEVDEMVRLYQSGLSLAKVGAAMGFDAHTVLKRLRDRGIERRDTHGRQRVENRPSTA